MEKAVNLNQDPKVVELDDLRNSDAEQIEEESQLDDLKNSDAEQIKEESQLDDLRNSDAEQIEEEQSQLDDLKNSDAEQIKEESQLDDLKNSGAEQIEEEKIESSANSTKCFSISLQTCIKIAFVFFSVIAYNNTATKQQKNSVEDKDDFYNGYVPLLCAQFCFVCLYCAFKLYKHEGTVSEFFFRKRAIDSVDKLTSNDIHDLNHKTQQIIDDADATVESTDTLGLNHKTQQIIGDADATVESTDTLGLNHKTQQIIGETNFESPYSKLENDFMIQKVDDQTKKDL